MSNEELSRTGLTFKDIQKIKSYIGAYGGTVDEVAFFLARSFKVLIWIFFSCITALVISLFYYPKEEIIGGGIAMLIVMAIGLLMRPPVLSYKCWRDRKMHEN